MKEKNGDSYVCPSCKAVVCESDQFCPNCGISAEDEETKIEASSKKKDTGYKCPKCSQSVEPKQKICANCNTILFFEEKEDIDKRLTNIKKYSLGQKLLREREYLFEEIYKEVELNPKINYLTLCALLFSSVYGFCLGIYSGILQMIAGAIKIPLLLFFTLLVCAPALYTFNVLLGSKLSFKQIVCMLLVKTYLISIILISFSPIIAFFIISGGSHDFTTLLNVGMFGIAGLFGVSLLWSGLRYLTIKSGYEPSYFILTVWILIYMFVGTQLAWTLRPFVGAEGSFSLFRNIEGNIYIYVLKTIDKALSGY